MEAAHAVVVVRGVAVALDNGDLAVPVGQQGHGRQPPCMPMATPMLIVATILQVTGIWNDYLFGLIFAGKDNYPMTVQLNNLVNTTFGERRYHIDMAATILTSLVPLAIYFFSGRWFVRGIAAGAVKG
jgi:glucose/mannose transport system permease protein